MKKFLLVAAGMLFLLGMGQVASAQVSATQYTLSDIYYYLTDGTEATWGNHSLEPPAGSTPGDTQFFTLSDIYGACLEHATSPYEWGDPEHKTVLDHSKEGKWYDRSVSEWKTMGTLMWASDGAGAGCYNGNVATWSDAETWAEGLDFAGYTDWELPTIWQLYSLQNMNEGSAPYIDQNFFPNTYGTGNYWSYTIRADDTSFAYYISFSDGRVSTSGTAYSLYLRAVRGAN
jgi:Protein of unknown function (DUF1566)